MASNDVQNAYTNWNRRAAQFRAAGIPDSTWTKLYQQDIQNVMGGSQGMSDAEIYAGVSSANKGPQIADPLQQQHGHGKGFFGVMSGIADTLGNIPTDISGIVHGAPAGIYHTVRNIIPETEQTGQLLYNLAEGNNAWLQKKGYLNANEKLHESWSDWSLILRAMNRNGDKQLLPYLPMLSDMANMTSGQGRVNLMQHPVGSFLDALPGISNVGKLAMAGRDFGFVDAATGQVKKLDGGTATFLKQLKDSGQIDDALYQEGLKRYAKPYPFPSQEPRLWAAGRALKEGNPVKAAISATGDLIPSGYKDEIGGSMTLRQRSLVFAKVNNFAKFQRQGLIRGLAERTPEFEAFSKNVRHDLFKNTIWDKGGLTTARAEFLFKIASDVNPLNAEVFRSVDEKNTFINTHLQPEERGAMNLMQDLAEKERKDTIERGWGKNFNYTDVIAKILGYRPTADVYMTVAKGSPVDVAHDAVMETEAELAKVVAELKVGVPEAVSRLNEYVGASAGTGEIGLQAPRGEVGALHSDKSIGELMDERTRLQKKLADRNETLAKAQATFAPDEWRPAITAYLQTGLRNARNGLTQAMTAQELDAVIKDLDASTYDETYKRLMGADKYEALKQDALKWMFKMATEGDMARPMFVKSVDKQAMDAILNPHIHEITAGIPKMYSVKDYGLYMGHTVQDLALALTASQVEKMRHDVVAKYITDFLVPRAYTAQSKLAEYQGGIDQARAAGAKNLPTAQQLVAANMKELKASDYGLAHSELGDIINGLLVDQDTTKLLQAMVQPSQFLKHGGRIFQKGTSLYKFAVLTGVRHYTHVLFGGFAFMMLSEPLAAGYLFKAWRMMRNVDVHGYDYSALGLPGQMMGGLRQQQYEIGAQPTWNKSGIPPLEAWNMQAMSNLGEMVQTHWLHEAKTKGMDFLKLVPNKLAGYEENIISMYKIATYLSGRRVHGMDVAAAMEQANKLYVDVNSLAPIERTVIKQVFPFYAFTKHLFRYLFNYPVDHPVRAAIITNFAEGEQADWNSGFPRSFMNLYWLGSKIGPFSTPSFLKPKDGEQWTFDMKNMNPFRSFANDFSIAGFTSSMSPFLTTAFSAAGFNTLTGTTQLYPGSYYDPESGSLKATKPAGWEMGSLEGFVPELGLLDHYFKLTQGTKILARVDPEAYQKQLFDMLNMPFVPEKINIPYEKEVTEMRRFRNAQSYVNIVAKSPTPQNIAKLLQYNVVPFDNTLIAAPVLAAYYQRVAAIMAGEGLGGVSPKAVLPKKTAPKARYANF